MTLTNPKPSRHIIGGSAKFRAWTASIFIHLIVLTAFGAVKFPKFQPKEVQLPSPVAKVSRKQSPQQSEPIIPKPKMKKLITSGYEWTDENNTKQLLPTPQFFESSKPTLQNFVNFEESAVKAGEFGLSESLIAPQAIEFFGSFSHQRKICYVVDCSGSMQGIFERVRKKLTESIETLQPDQYFYIIFFGDERLFEFGNGRLVRAAENAKSAAYDFIRSIRPAGRTNAMAALEKALQIRDSAGHSPSVVYFLTDGFELESENTRDFSQKISGLLKRFAPETKINTIGFWPQETDRRMLKEIASQSGGECIFVNE